jgi:hypothetical protein
MNNSYTVYMKHAVISRNKHVTCCRVRIVLDTLNTGIVVLNLVLDGCTSSLFLSFILLSRYNSADRCLLQVDL